MDSWFRMQRMCVWRWKTHSRSLFSIFFRFRPDAVFEEDDDDEDVDEDDDDEDGEEDDVDVEDEDDVDGEDESDYSSRQNRDNIT